MTIRWKGYLGGKPGSDLSNTIAFVLPEGRQPNRFNRLMQYLILGIYWQREPRQLVQHKEEHDQRRHRDDKGDQQHRNFGVGHNGVPR